MQSRQLCIPSAYITRQIPTNTPFSLKRHPSISHGINLHIHASPPRRTPLLSLGRGLQGQVKLHVTRLGGLASFPSFPSFQVAHLRMRLAWGLVFLKRGRDDTHKQQHPHHQQCKPSMRPHPRMYTRVQRGHAPHDLCRRHPMHVRSVAPMAIPCRQPRELMLQPWRPSVR